MANDVLEVYEDVPEIIPIKVITDEGTIAGATLHFTVSADYITTTKLISKSITNTIDPETQTFDVPILESDLDGLLPDAYFYELQYEPSGEDPIVIKQDRFLVKPTLKK